MTSWTFGSQQEERHCQSEAKNIEPWKTIFNNFIVKTGWAPDASWLKCYWPFFFEAPAWKSFSSLKVTLLYFIRQKNERRAPEQSRAAPTGSSACTCNPAAHKHQSDWLKEWFSQKRIFCYLLTLTLFQIFFLPKAIQRLRKTSNTAHESYGLLLLCFMPGNRFETSGRVNNQLRMNNEKSLGLVKILF